MIASVSLVKAARSYKDATVPARRIGTTPRPEVSRKHTTGDAPETDRASMSA